MKVIWTLASGKAFDRPTSFGRLCWAGASTLIGDRSVLLWEASNADVQACPHSLQFIIVLYFLISYNFYFVLSFSF